MSLFWIILGGAVVGFGVNRVGDRRLSDPVAAGVGVAFTLAFWLALTVLPTVLATLGYLLGIALILVMAYMLYLFLRR